MHYYKRHLGDYAKKAGHLSPLEHGVYTLILDSYYDREQAPTLIEATRWARARTEDEKSAVLAVLDEFFKLENGRYVQNRVEEELGHYQGKAETNRVIAVERERRKRERREHESCTNGAPEYHDPHTFGQPNQEPRTKNQEPEKTNTPIPPEGGEGGKRKTSAIALKTYLADCKEAGTNPIPDDDPVFDYVEKVGIPEDFLRLQWLEFKERYTLPDAKRYKAWRTVFMKSVQGNWFKIWYVSNDGSYVLTTVGQQADRNHKDAA